MSKTVDSAVFGMCKFWKNGAPKTNLLTILVDSSDFEAIFMGNNQIQKIGNKIKNDLKQISLGH